MGEEEESENSPRVSQFPTSAGAKWSERSEAERAEARVGNWLTSGEFFDSDDEPIHN